MYNQQVCHIQRSSKLLLPAKGCESWKSAHYCTTAANAECLTLSVTEKVGSAYSAQPNESHEHHVASVLQNSAKPGGGQPGLGSTQGPRQPLRPDLHRRSFSKYGTEAAGLVTRSATVLEWLEFRPTTGLMPQHFPACRLVCGVLVDCSSVPCLQSTAGWAYAQVTAASQVVRHYFADVSGWCCSHVSMCPNRPYTPLLQL